jgi:membrane protease YdiL (CAAX protease family)
MAATTPAPAAHAPRAAAWRPRTATVAVVAGLIATQAAGWAIATINGGGAVVALSLVISDVLLLAVILAVARRGAERLGAATLGIRRTAWGPALGWGTALLFAGFAFDGLTAAVVAGLSGGARHHAHLHTTHLAPGVAVLVTLAVAVAAPLAEEITFRGYLFPALTRWRGPWVGAVATALLFGAAHLASLPVPFQLGAAFFGFGLCLLFWFTGSLLPCVTVHSFNNAIVLAVVTGGQLALALVAAPALCLLVLAPFARERA